MKRLMLVLVLLVMLPVLATAPASNAPADNVQTEDMAETAKRTASESGEEHCRAQEDDAGGAQ